MLGEIFEFYARNARSLKDVYENNAVIPIIDFEAILELFLVNSLIVLGGDLYKMSINGLEHTYDSWYDESGDVLTSVETAKKYLLDYPDKTVYVKFVVKSN